MTGVVYRVYDANDCLLYVGSTGDLPARLSVHRREAPWWPAAVRMTRQDHGLLIDARIAERTAIDTEHPLFNLRTTGADQRGIRVSDLLLTASRVPA